MKEKILIVGGSHSELPLVRAAKSLGLHVITTGNQPRGLAHREADETHLVDYADPEAITTLARQLKVDHLCFGAHDLSMISTIHAAKSLGIGHFDTPETTRILHHKNRFKHFAKRVGLPSPRAFEFSDPTSALRHLESRALPRVVKPVDMGGGKGVYIIRTPEESSDAILTAFENSKNGTIIIEEYFPGTLHSFSTFLINRRVVFDYADDEYPCPDNPYGVCTSTAPAAETGESIRRYLIEICESVADALELKDGLLHMQYLRHGSRVAVVEFTRRMPGDMYNVPVERSTGCKYAENIVRFCCGETPELSFHPARRFVSRHCIVASTGSEVRIDPRLEPYIFQREVWGDLQETAKKGILFLEYPSRMVMQETTTSIHSFVQGIQS